MYVPGVCSMSLHCPDKTIISSLVANHFAETTLCSTTERWMIQKFRMSKDKHMSKKNQKRKEKRREKKKTQRTHPEMKGVCSLSHQRKGEQRWKWQLPAQLWCIQVLIFLMFLMRVYWPPIVCHFSTWSPPYDLFLKYFCQIHLPLLGFRRVP